MKFPIVFAFYEKITSHARAFILTYGNCLPTQEVYKVWLSLL